MSEMRLAWKGLTYNADMNAKSVPVAEIWLDRALLAGRTWFLNSIWSVQASPLAADNIPDGFRVVLFDGSDWATSLVGEFEEATVLLIHDAGILIAHLACADHAGGKRVMTRLRELFPEPAEPSEQLVPTRFWFNSSNGPQSKTREIVVPCWDEVRDNYPAQTRSKLEHLANGFHPEEAAGKILLFHGPAGTGKTYALRSLAWEWRAWSRINYITDPDEFFGRRPNYLIDVALHTGDGPGNRGNGDRPEFWQVLVLEDTGELLAPDAKLLQGQSLSRLLNLSDGLLGQGLKLLVLITTNEPIDRIHPAVSRAGRCLSTIEFQEFSNVDGNEWLARRGDPEAGLDHSGSFTLADLHAILRGEEARVARRGAGFSARLA